jgi:hypothetical protein
MSRIQLALWVAVFSIVCMVHSWPLSGDQYVLTEMTNTFHKPFSAPPDPNTPKQEPVVLPETRFHSFAALDATFTPLNLFNKETQETVDFPLDPDQHCRCTCGFSIVYLLN